MEVVGICYYRLPVTILDILQTPVAYEILFLYQSERGENNRITKKCKPVALIHTDYQNFLYQ